MRIFWILDYFVLCINLWQNYSRLINLVQVIEANFPGWPPYTKTAYHTIPYIKCMEKKLVTQFSYLFEKQYKKLNHFCGLLRTVEQTGDKKKLIWIFFEKNA